MISAAALARLATPANTIAERLAAPAGAANDAGDADQADARIARWAELGAKGDRERLRRSLKWRGIDLDRIRPALCAAAPSQDAQLPPWARRFAALLEGALSDHRKAATDPQLAVEHAAVMAPFARAAATALRQAMPAPTRAGIAEGALAALERSLLLRLTRIASGVLASAYYVYAYSDSRAGGAAATRPRRFADHVLQPPLPEFLAEYPVLARLVTLACDNWQAAALELLGRLAGDRPAIAERFHDDRDPGALVDIEVGDADVHDGHREVVTLVFEDGFRIVYKPRSLDLDRAFGELIDWLNARGLSPALRSPAVWCRHGYGWAEFITHRPAADATERVLFYRRAGVLACVAYVMGASDLHHGNLIADGGDPIVVDLETMLRATPRGDALPAAPSAAQIAALGGERSVLHTLLLPVTQRVQNGVHVDLSALGAGADAQAERDCPWLPVAPTALAQVLREHACDIEAGFVAAYRLIKRHRAALLAESGPLRAFEHCSIRVVLRDTALYFRLLRHSIDPAVLRDGADRAIALERLHHVIAIADSPPSFVAMVTREQAALSALDVPRFAVMADQTDLRDAAGIVAENVMERTPLQEMRLRLAAMDARDLRRQRTDIRWALYGSVAGRPASWPRGGPPNLAAAPPDAAKLIAAAVALATDLLEEADCAGDKPPAWRGLIYLPAAQRFTVGDGGASLADGGLGIAVLFAALGRVTEHPRWRDAARGLALKYLAPPPDTRVYLGHVAGGIAAGLGGSLYAAALVAALIQDDEVLACGLAVAKRLAARAIDEDKDFTLGEGLAGSLLGLAAMRRLAADASLDEVAARGAARLRKIDPLAADGLLRGQAGVALAAHAIGLPSDLSFQQTLVPHAAIDWAEGAVGAASAALQAASNADTPLNFLESLASAPAAVDDGFAFGTAGEADALAWAAARFQRPHLHRLALQRMAEPVERAFRGTPRLFGGKLGAGLRMRGLLHGSAGVAYTLLRLAAPNRLPALAVFELPLEREVA